MNPIGVNSANIINFGYKAVFKLFEKLIHFDITDITTFVSGNAGNVQGVYFKVVDPTGITIKDFDYTTPDIDPTDVLTFDVTIPSAVFGFGWYTLTGQVKDADDTLYTVTLRKNVCMPADFNSKGYIDGQMTSLINCYTPSVRISEETNFSYLQSGPSSIDKAGNFYFPQGTVDSVSFTFTPFAVIGAGQVYTGDYLVKNTSTAQYDQNDNVFVEIKYITNLKFSVVCNSNLNALLCCFQDLSDLYYEQPQSEKGLDAKYKLDKAYPLLFNAVIKEKVGQDASKDVERIKTILDCNCNSTTGLLDPISLGVDNNNPQVIQLQQAGGVTIDTATAGNTTNYTISTKIVQLTKDSGDLNFSISKTESQYGIVYTLAFDYSQLAETILDTIQADDGLVALLRGILNSNSDIDLSGLIQNCIISINSCNYVLVEANNTPKTIDSITIDNVAHNAPSNLLLTNTSGIATWLNGLSLGTFTANLDSGSNTIAIVSNSNSHIVQSLAFTVGVTQTIRQFNRSCANLVDVLNAITEYVCAIDGTEVKFGATGLQIYTINSDGVTINKSNVSSNSSVAGVLTLLIQAQNSLITSLSGTGLNCTNIKTLFSARDLTILPTDVVLGTKNGQCTSITNDEYASILLDNILSSSTLTSKMCAITQSCSGAVCSPVTNLSATFSAGTLTVAANGVVGTSAPIKIFYRRNNSGLTFTEVDGVGSDLPKAIGAGALDAAQYEVQLQQQCTNGVWSPIASAVSNNTCQVPQAFTVNISGTNFVIAATLTNPQTKIELTITDPNGGVTTAIHDFGASTYAGTYNVAIPAGLYGLYQFKARAVCDDSPTPIYASDYTATSFLDVANPLSNNITLSASYGMAITACINGTGSGIPAAFNSPSPAVTGNLSAHTDSLTNGTYQVTLSGTIPGVPIYLKLVRNGTDVRDTSAAISGPGTITLTNSGGIITYPDTISIEIDS